MPLELKDTVVLCFSICNQEPSQRVQMSFSLLVFFLFFFLLTQGMYIIYVRRSLQGSYIKT